MIRCRLCGKTFFVCRCCWRGQAYCSEQCRVAGQRKMHREAQRRYRRTDKGKRAHCLAENRRRYGLNENNQKNMDDASSTVPFQWGKGVLRCIKNRPFHVDTLPKCHFCGSYGLLVDAFPRRGYG